MLAELQEYATRNPPPNDADSVPETVEYHRACNQIFERGILGKGVFIRTSDNPILNGMEAGYKYFAQWLHRKLQSGMFTPCIVPMYIQTLSSCLQATPLQ